MFAAADWALMLAALSTSLPVSFTPGPNNIICAAIGARHGSRRALPYALGVTIGFPLMLCATGFGLAALLRLYPQIQTAAQIAGTLFLFYLSYRIATAPFTDINRERAQVGGVPGFWYAVAFQWVNPKGVSFAFSFVALYTRPHAMVTDMLLLMTMSMFIALSSTMTWAFTGDVLSRFLQTPRRHRLFNVAMAALLLSAAVSILFYER